MSINHSFARENFLFHSSNFIDTFVTLETDNDHEMADIFRADRHKNCF